jgi:L-seryl-tRNA(Ser) seleniumtransferase
LDLQEKNKLYRALPSVDKLLNQTQVSASLPPALVTSLARKVLDNTRKMIEAGEATEVIALETLVARLEQEVNTILELSLCPVINATGVVLHTNLGRAPLSQAAAKAAATIASNFSTLEFDLATGERGCRLDHVSALLAQVSGAEAGIVVNNCASAILMVLTCFARDREMILSRSQAVEIGGSFRIPDVMAQSGVRLVEVGTTNKTYAHDYTAAISPTTWGFMHVHSSNFKIIGFTHNPTLAELAQLAHAHNLVLIDDLGSGALLDTAQYGLAHEPTVQESLAAGTDLVLFSGDKLLGGPQAGLIVGRQALIDKLKKHPLARALRVDKMTLAALQVTLQHYLKGETTTHIPSWHMLAQTPTQLEQRAAAWLEQLGAWPGAKLIPGFSTVGGGSLPGETLPTYLLALPALSNRSIDALTTALRKHTPPLIGRVERETLLLDPRTVLAGEDEIVVAALKQLLS